MELERYYLRVDNEGTKEEKRYLASSTIVTKADATTGVVDAIVSVMGNIDLQDDIIHQGAFTKTIQERGLKNIRVLDNHNFFSTEDAIAVPLEIREITRHEMPEDVLAAYPHTTGGLFTSSQFMLDDQKSAAVFKRLKSGAINQYSIGFQIVKQDFNEQEVPEGSGFFREIRNIREIRLFEYSPVLFAANPATVTVGVKGINLPISINMAVVKRATTAKSCANCIFFGKVAENVGYCKKHDGTTKTLLICDAYAPTAAMQETYGKQFATHVETSLKAVFEQWTTLETKSDLLASIPEMVQSITRMLPSDVVDMPYVTTSSEPPSANQPQGTDDTPAATTVLSKAERQALIAEITQRKQARITQ